MEAREVLRQILGARIIVAARGITEETAVPFAQAAIAGGVKLIEVTFDQADADTIRKTAEKIRLISNACAGQVLVGAGTVLSVAQAEAAAEAGAQYLLSPSFDEAVVRRTKELGLVSVPGVMTPTEAQNAYLAGADIVKLFPTGVLGIPYIKAIRAPLNHIPMIAMGGVNEQNLKDFLAVCEGVGVGAAICDRNLLAAGDYAEITRRALAFTSQV